MYQSSNIKAVILAFLAVCILLNRPENAIAQNPSGGIAYDVEFTAICLVDSIAPNTINQFWRFTHSNNPGGYKKDVLFDLSGSYTVQGTVLSCKDYYAATDFGPHPFLTEADSLNAWGNGFHLDLPGQNNTVIGFNALKDSLQNDQSRLLVAGANAAKNYRGSNSVILGTDAAPDLITGSGSVIIGNQALDNVTSTGNSVLLGNSVASSSTGNIERSVFLGHSAASNFSGTAEGIFLGYRVALNATNLFETNTLGYEAGLNSPNLSRSVLIGKQAGASTNVSFSNIIGNNASNSGNSASSANIIGYNAGNSDVFQACVIGNGGAGSTTGRNRYGAFVGNINTENSYTNYSSGIGFSNSRYLFDDRIFSAGSFSNYWGVGLGAISIGYGADFANIGDYGITIGYRSNQNQPVDSLAVDYVLSSSFNATTEQITTVDTIINQLGASAGDTIKIKTNHGINLNAWLGNQYINELFICVVDNDSTVTVLGGGFTAIGTNNFIYGVPEITNYTTIGKEASATKSDQVLIGGVGQTEFKLGDDIQVIDFAGIQIYTGTGSPEGVITAPPGSLYSNKSGGAGTTLYVKESGTGNTGWVGK